MDDDDDAVLAHLHGAGWRTREVDGTRQTRDPVGGLWYDDAGLLRVVRTRGWRRKILGSVEDTQNLNRDEGR